MKNFPLILFVFLLMGMSCKKPGGAAGNALLEQYFETNVLNRNFTVSLAQDNGADLTANYNGYVFEYSIAPYFSQALLTILARHIYVKKNEVNVYFLSEFK